MRTFLVALISIFILQACSSSASEKKNNDLSPDVITVKLEPIRQVSSETRINISGLLTTENEARLSFKIPGIIEYVFASEGQQVKKGQLLASLKPTEISSQVQQARLALEKAERDHQRANNLYKDSVATLEQLQNAGTALDLAKQTYQQVAFNHAYSKIYAPADGFIVKKAASEGEMASPGSTVIVMNVLSGNSRWILKAGIPDRDWSLIQKGDKAAVTFDAFPSRTFHAVVSSKALASDVATGSFEVELQVNFDNVRPAAGMFGRASIIPAATRDGITIPFESLIEANGKTGYVFVTNDSSTVKKVPVSIGSINNNDVLIVSGLEGYAAIVTAGSPFLNERSVITVKN